MKRFLKIIVVLAGLAALAVILTAALTPWMDRWGATDDEVARNMPRLLDMWPAHDTYLERSGTRYVFVFEPADAT